MLASAVDPERRFVADTDADGAFLDNEGTITIRADASGTYTTELNDGSSVVTDVRVPAIDWDGIWNVMIESWTQGETFTRTETRDNTDPYTGQSFEVDGSSRHTTVETGYDTNRTVVLDAEIDNAEMTSWKDMYRDGLSPLDLAAVSGVGTYSTEFALPADWRAPDGILVDLGRIDGMIGLKVNGTPFPVNINNPVVDIGAALAPGENQMTVTVATSTTNAVTNGREQAVRAFPDGGPSTGPDFYKILPSAYGLTGPVTLTPYGAATIDAP